MKKAWYAVGPSDLTVHGLDYIVYRDGAGEVHAFDAYCPHRGCDLALGTIDNGELICPFHGWRFNSEGKCTRVPANRDGAKPPGRSYLVAYYTLEKAGLIWVYTYPQKHLNDKPELSIFPEIESEGWSYAPLQATWNAHFTRTVESTLDISHLPFVHPETSGTDIIPVVDGPEYSVSDNHIRIHPTPFAPAHPMEPIHPPIAIEERTEIELLFPNKWIIRTPMGDGTWMCTFLTFTPRNAETTDIFGGVMRNFGADNDLLDEFHLEHTRFVMDQDKLIIESLKPVIAPFDLKKEVHVPSDGATIHYRTMLREALKDENGK